MKFLAVILSLYIVVLTAKPCDDIELTQKFPGITFTAEVHSHHMDSCSPLCICQCCQAHFQVTFSPDYSYYAKASPNYIIYSLNHSASSPSEFLIPPEIS